MPIDSSQTDRIVHVKDCYGVYYYVVDDLGFPTHGGYTAKDAAAAALEVVIAGGDAEQAPRPDVAIDEVGHRLDDCIYCHRQVRSGAVVPKVSDDSGWQEARRGHDPDCEWVVTRAHQR